jgi:cytochrome b
MRLPETFILLDTGGADVQKSATTAIESLWDFEVRASAVFLALLLVVAYVTGEETQHTHAILGYALAGVVITQIWWELHRPHASRYVDSVFHPERVVELFKRASSDLAHRKIAAGTFVLAVAMLVDILSIFALVLVFLTHNFYSATAVDEMHEVVAYLALGLVVFHIALVIIASMQRLDR